MEKEGLEKQKEIFENACYEAYKLHWMLSQGDSLTELFDTIVGLAAEQIDTDPMQTPVNGEQLTHLMTDAKESFLDDVGFSGSLWVCKEEFLNAEFYDRGYMHGLFSLMDCGDSMQQFYDENYGGAKEESDKKPYWVTMRIEGRYIPNVMAKDPTEAREEAARCFVDADFGELEDIDGECVIVEDENGNYVWEKE